MGNDRMNEALHGSNDNKSQTEGPVGDADKTRKQGRAGGQDGHHKHGQHDEHDGHSHGHKYRKQIVNRLARIEGHIRAVKEMTAQDRDCSEVLLQIAAVQKALDQAAKLLLKDHLENCVVHAVRHGTEDQVLEQLNRALDNYIR